MLSLFSIFNKYFCLGFGCENPTVPAKTQLKRKDNQAQIVCEGSGQIYILTCVNGQWEGNVGKCAVGGRFIYIYYNYF